VIDEIQTIQDIQQLVRQGFTDWTRYGEVNVVSEGNLRLFNYNTRAQFMNRWNFFEQASRGLILNATTGEVVARPFDKFFNWLEGGRRSDGPIVTITEKIDGSLGILYRTAGSYRIATRGNFTSVQAEWATRRLKMYHNLADLPDELTLLFEIVFPANRNVVIYADREDLVLLAARNRFTGDYLPFFPHIQNTANRYGFSLPSVYSFHDLAELLQKLAQLGIDEEGYVAEFDDGQRFKFKGDRYLELQKALLGLTYKRVLQAMRDRTIQPLRESVPEEYLTDVNRWMAYIQAVLDDITTRTSAAFAAAPKNSRKEFAAWVQAEHADIATYLFATLNGRSIEPLIFKMLADISRPEE
jgi:RNA ligase